MRSLSPTLHESDRPTFNSTGCHFSGAVSPCANLDLVTYMGRIVKVGPKLFHDAARTLRLQHCKRRLEQCLPSNQAETKSSVTLSTPKGRYSTNSHLGLKLHMARRALVPHVRCQSNITEPPSVTTRACSQLRNSGSLACSSHPQAI